MIRFFKIVTPILLSISLVACSSASGKTEKITAPIEKDRNLSMVVTTDVHYFAPSLTDNGKAFEKYVAAGDGKQLAYSDEITDAFLADVEAKKQTSLLLVATLRTTVKKQVMKS